MMIVDASVWVAAADATDAFCGESRRFLAAVVRHRLPISVPAFARIEVACALTRKIQDAVLGRQLANGILACPLLSEIALDPTFLARSLHVGTDALLRGADSLYATAAEVTGGILVSWDSELLRRAGALTPVDWLTANP